MDADVPSSLSNALREVVDAAFWEAGAKALAAVKREANTANFMMEVVVSSVAQWFLRSSQFKFPVDFENRSCLLNRVATSAMSAMTKRAIIRVSYAIIVIPDPAERDHNLYACLYQSRLALWARTIVHHEEDTAKTR